VVRTADMKLSFWHPQAPVRYAVFFSDHKIQYGQWMRNSTQRSLYEELLYLVFRFAPLRTFICNATVCWLNSFSTIADMARCDRLM